MINKNKIVFDISFSAIMKVVFVILLLLFLWGVREVLALLFTALIFASAIDSWIDWFEARHIPRGISVLSIYMIVFAIISLMVYLLIPPIAEQVNELTNQFPQIYERLEKTFGVIQTFSAQHGLEKNIREVLNNFNQYLTSSIGNIFPLVSGIFGGLASFILVLILTFYMTVEEAAVKRSFYQLLPDKYRPYLSQLFNKIQTKVGAWLQGQIFLSFIIGLVTTTALLLAGVKYALVLGLIAGLLEFVPYLGPILSAVPALFLAFFQSPTKALIVLIIYILIQQLENNLIVPKVMQKAVGLNPIITISALLIGMNVAGIIGALLAIPIATALSVILKELYSHDDKTV